MTTTPDLWRPGFIDNQNTAGQQFDGVVAPTASNTFFAVWLDQDNFNGGVDTIVARSFNSLGNPVTGDVPLPLGTFIRDADDPQAVRLPIAGQGDGLAVAFESHFAANDTDIYLVRRDANLAQFGPPFTVIDNTAENTDNPAITSFSNGEVWVSFTDHITGANWDIEAQRVGANGALIGAPITLFDFGNIRADNSDLATLANGNFVGVATREFLNNPNDHDVFFTIRTETGGLVVAPTPVNGANDTPGDENLPHVAALADGGFVVTWEDSLGDLNGTSQGIRAAVYDASGTLVAGNILVNVFNQAGLQLNPDVTALPDGGFVVAWEDVGPDLVDRAQRFDEAGNLVGTPIVFSGNATFDIDAATFSDGRSIFTINDFFTVPGNNNVVSSIWDTRITDANQTTGENFFGAVGSPADLFLIRDINGVRQLEAIQTNGTATVFGTVGTNQNFVGSGDFNGDGLSDLLINVDNTPGIRTFLVDQMNPTGIQAQFQIAVRGADWITDAVADFNQNGTSDILVHRDVGLNRTLEVMVMNNNTVVANTTIGVNGTNWQVDGTGDFNGNGTQDILQHRIDLASDSMTLRSLEMTPGAVQVQSAPTLGVIGANIQVDGVGDFNHNGTADILVHSDAGGVRTFQVLTVQNSGITGAVTVAQTGTNISVGGVGDFNGDGTSDFLVHQDVGTTRTDIVYSVVNNVVVGTQTVAVTGIDWHVA
jgi:hypothetical protein